MKHRRYYKSFMKDLVEDILQQTSLPRRFLMQDIGAPSYFMMLLNYANLVMHVKELEV
jgi:hypothetical protein